MTRISSYSLRDLLRKADTGTLGNGEVCDLHEVCRRIASILIRKKIAAGKLNPAMLGLSVEDITLDCIADLFATSPEGRLFEISEYFENKNIDVSHSSEDLLYTHLRRLVFSKIHDNIFRIYGELDPALARIIRNLKLALRKSNSFTLVTIFDELFLVPADGEPDDGKPELSTAMLQEEVERSLIRNDSIPAVLAHIVQCLETQDAFRRRIPLLRLAYCIKAGYVKLGWLDHPGVVEPVDGTFLADIERVISECCASLRMTIKERYLAAGKLTEDELNGYWKAIVQILRSEYLGDPDGHRCYFEHLRSMLPGITKADYSDRHRGYFEYMAILARNRVKRELMDM